MPGCVGYFGTRSDVSLLADIPGFEPATSRVLLSFSGGPDSVYLALCLKEERPVKLTTLVYFDHDLRPRTEIEYEQSFVREFGATHGFSVHLESLPVALQAKQLGESLEEAGRHLRYQRLANLAKSAGVGFIFTAHHLDDNVESVLMKWVRGSLSGLTPMRRFREREGACLVRPLLATPKSHILAVLAQKKMPYCTDSSNASAAFLRNRIRSALIPAIERLNPQYRRAVLGLADYHADLKRFVDDALKATLAEAKPTADGWEIPRGVLVALDPFLQGELIRRLIILAYGADFRVSAIHIKAILEQLQKSGCKRVNLPGNRWATITRAALLLN
jgi:tRNA(Ile)-lysidine synthase